jgi:hypothetical protein
MTDEQKQEYEQKKRMEAVGWVPNTVAQNV